MERIPVSVSIATASLLVVAAQIAIAHSKLLSLTLRRTTLLGSQTSPILPISKLIISGVLVMVHTTILKTRSTHIVHQGNTMFAWIFGTGTKTRRILVGLQAVSGSQYLGKERLAIHYWKWPLLGQEVGRQFNLRI